MSSEKKKKKLALGKQCFKKTTMVNKTRIRRDAKRGKDYSGKPMREEFQKSENESQFAGG